MKSYNKSSRSSTTMNKSRKSTKTSRTPVRTPVNHLSGRLRGFGNATAKTLETVQIAYDAPNKASTILTIKPTITAKDVVYSVPRFIHLYVVSNESTFIRVFSNFGSIENTSIIARTAIRAVGSTVQQIKLTITDKIISEAIGIIDSPVAITNPSFTIETSGRVIITGKAHFEFGTGIDFPDVPTLSSLLKQSELLAITESSAPSDSIPTDATTS